MAQAQAEETQLRAKQKEIQQKVNDMSEEELMALHVNSKEDMPNKEPTLTHKPAQRKVSSSLVNLSPLGTPRLAPYRPVSQSVSIFSQLTDLETAPPIIED